MSSAYSVKVKKCAELWKPRLRSATSSVIVTIMAAVSSPASQAIP